MKFYKALQTCSRGGVRMDKKEEKKYDSGMWPATKVQRMRYVSYLTLVVRV